MSCDEVIVSAVKSRVNRPATQATVKELQAKMEVPRKELGATDAK